LTVAGIEQHHHLGRYLRTRYGSLLSSNYSASEIAVRSTDYDRTLMSAQSNLMGLYPLYNISDDTVPVQPIPIHTVPINQDFVGSI
jgi:lysosomal acid phosphatase